MDNVFSGIKSFSRGVGSRRNRARSRCVLILSYGIRMGSGGTPVYNLKNHELQLSNNNKRLD